MQRNAALVITLNHLQDALLQLQGKHSGLLAYMTRAPRFGSAG